METLCDFVQELDNEYFINDIYPEEPKNPKSQYVKRKLTTKEKECIIKKAVEFFFVDMFKSNETVHDHFLEGKICFAKNNNGLTLLWLDQKSLNGTIMCFSNVGSELICKLIQEYEMNHDVGMLEDVDFFNEKTK